MSAIPKKKLCWHCEGSIERNVDNCPFCGVYIHAPEEEEAAAPWNPSFRITSLNAHRSSVKEEESQEENEEEVNEIKSLEGDIISFDQIQKDLLPLILLLIGSSFFLFGIVLYLFSYEGVLTLQWNGDNWIYYVLTAIPSLVFGWWYLNKE